MQTEEYTDIIKTATVWYRSAIDLTILVSIFIMRLKRCIAMYSDISSTVHILHVPVVGSADEGAPKTADASDAGTKHTATASHAPTAGETVMVQFTSANRRVHRRS